MSGVVRQKMRFLVESGTALGDCAIDVALFRAIARHGHHLEVIAGDFASGLLAGCDFIDALHPKKPKSMALHNAMMYWRLSRREWDVVVTTRFVPRIQIVGLFRHRYRLRASDKLESLGSADAVMPRLSILRDHIPDWDSQIDTRIPFAERVVDEALEFCRLRRGERYISVAPGASAQSKMWPIENFAAVAGMIRDREDMPVVAIGTSGEGSLCARLAESCGAVNTAGRIGLAQACALASNSALHLGNNSGMSHVAAGNHTPTITVGPPQWYAPWRQHIIAEPLAKISPQQVMEVVDRIL